jgi:integrase
MPRRRARPLFELGGQWIARDPGSPFLHRFWTEPGTGRTRRASLRTEDLKTAERLLAEIVVKGAPKTVNAPLSAVLLDYFENRTDKLPSKKPARAAGRQLLAFWGETVRVAAITEAKQKEFAEKSIAKGNSLSYISRNLSVLAAAFAHAQIHQKVIFGQAAMRDRWALRPKATGRVFVPSDDDLAKFLELPVVEDFWRWEIMSLLTGARPEAVLQLTPGQREREVGLVALNPADRVQNKKFRATVREPKALTTWLDRWEEEMRAAKRKSQCLGEGEYVDISGDPYCGYASMESVQSAIEGYRGGKNSNTNTKVALPRLSAKSFRHKVTTVLRKARLSEDEIGIQLGHRREATRTTAGYGEWDPDYLTAVADALDAWFLQLQTKMKTKSIWAFRVTKTPAGDAQRRA